MRRPPSRRSRFLPAPALVPAFSLLLAGCVVMPVTQTRWDPQCQQVTRHITLEPVQVGAIAACANRGCEALVIAGAVSVAASTIVSGSIAIVGNVAYWAEERGTCQARAAAASAPPPAIGADGLDPTPAPVPRPVIRPPVDPAASSPR